MVRNLGRLGGRRLAAKCEGEERDGGIAGANERTKARVLADVEKVAPMARAGVAKALADWNPDATLGAYHGPMPILVSPPNDTPAAP